LSFQDTPNKALIRTSWDRPILEKRVERKGSALAYFGLCGPEMLDIREWSNLVADKCCIEAPGNTSVERKQLPFRMARMKAVAQVYEIAEGFQPLVGKIEHVLLNGLDDEDKRPLLTNVNARAQETTFNYDLYNLDFDGGLGYARKGGAVERFDALSKLFERQRSHPFTLFLTVSLRNKVVGNLEDYLDSLRRRSYGDGWKESVAWHLKQGVKNYGYVLKAAVPIFIHKQAEARGFKPHCYPPIIYQGHERAVLVHFAFDFEVVVGQLGGVGQQSENDLVNLPLLQSADGSFHVVSQGCPGFSVDACLATLTPLPEDERERVLAGEPGELSLGKTAKGG
jgi:hypothetical protein